MKRTRVVLVDDHLLLMEAIKKLLEQEYDVVGMFNNGASLLDTAVSLKPDIAVEDLRGIRADRSYSRSIARRILCHAESY